LRPNREAPDVGVTGIDPDARRNLDPAPLLRAIAPQLEPWLVGLDAGSHSQMIVIGVEPRVDQPLRQEGLTGRCRRLAISQLDRRPPAAYERPGQGIAAATSPSAARVEASMSGWARTSNRFRFT